MANLKWNSPGEKFEAIGYLSIPGVICDIQAYVPYGKADDFKKNYEGLYSDEYPYEHSEGTDKRGNQFRIYLNDIEGCPDCLRIHLDNRYKNRINNTQFVDELVKEFGFRFKKGIQNDYLIEQAVYSKCKGKDKSLITAFKKGKNCYREFVKEIEGTVNERIISPIVLQFKRKTISKTDSGGQIKDSGTGGLTENQRLRLGWSGEQYIYNLLVNKDECLLDELGISKEDTFDVVWYNNGVQDVLEEAECTSVRKDISVELTKKWEDKSLGKGCDILVNLESGDSIFIEVKTSKRIYPYFNMTSSEMQLMEEKRDDYIIIKVNNFDRLLKGEAPEIISISDPYDKIFHPKQMKEATFVIGGK